jgi:type-F conjugative transfer system secretin TraK
MNRYLMVLCGLGFCSSVCADPYWVESELRINANIALNQLNRIQVFEDRITQVFGDDNTFSSETDTENGQIFIKAKDEKPLFLTIVTENGASIDLALNPIEIEAQTLILKTTASLKPSTEDKTKSYSDKIIALMKAMHQGSSIDGFTPLKATKRECVESLTLELQSIYQGDEIQGEVWRVTNTSHKTQTLTEKQFSTEPGIAALALQTLILEPYASTQLFKVKTHE